MLVYIVLFKFMQKGARIVLIASFLFAYSTDVRDCRRSSTQTPVPPQRLVEQFSFEQLRSVMASNHGTALGLYDEMSTMYE